MLRPHYQLISTVEIYHPMFALMDAVFGAEHSDQETLNSGLDMLKFVT
jgi:aminoglycoside 2''-phosphotransferase